MVIIEKQRALEEIVYLQNRLPELVAEIETSNKQLTDLEVTANPWLLSSTQKYIQDRQKYKLEVEERISYLQSLLNT